MGNDIDTTDKLEQLVNALTNTIVSAADKCAPYKTMDLQKNGQLPGEIKNLIKQADSRFAYGSTNKAGSPVWNNAAATHVNKLQVFQNKCLRLALSHGRYTSEANIPTVKDFVENSVEKFYPNTVQHSNPLVRQITDVRCVATNRTNPYENLPLYNADMPLLRKSPDM
ncbi:hypothetical protein Trydic_g7409 [Trypoxylus dichotomus]